MKKINRRDFCTAALGTALVTQVSGLSAGTPLTTGKEDAPFIIDTNVSLGNWPFRTLKYAGAEKLGAKLKKHRITQAWAGHFDALFHKNIDAVNEALVNECNRFEKGFFQPFGTVNLAWPDWEETLRRCHENYKMKGVRIYPSYQTFNLTHPDFPRFLSEVTRRKMILQIVGDMDDSRNFHPIVNPRDYSLAPLVDMLQNEPNARVHLLYWNVRVSAKLLDDLMAKTRVMLDTARIESAGGVEALLEGNQNQRDRVFSFGGMEQTVSEIPWSRAAKPVPADRLTFGSHAPFFPVENNLLKLFESELTLEQTRAIMEANARKLITT